MGDEQVDTEPFQLLADGTDKAAFGRQMRCEYGQRLGARGRSSDRLWWRTDRRAEPARLTNLPDPPSLRHRP